MNAYGIFRVTTEGDCEGRTVRDLGCHEGYIDEIALKLSDRAYYGLTFTSINLHTLKNILPICTKVHVSLRSDELDNKLWKLNENHQWQLNDHEIESIFKNRPVTIGSSNFYKSFTIVAGRDPISQEQARKNTLIASAKSKLTKEEITALNL